jgi:hypothetical protein
MTLESLQAAFGCPSPVAVHDDRNMPRYRLRVNAQSLSCFNAFFFE